jgi:serine/threonine-protein kinase
MQACQKCSHAIQGQPNFCPACGASLTFESALEDEGIIGRTIGGSYRLESLIGEGAMGRVYQAHHLQLRKKVAVKILRANLVSDTTVVKRFEREALAASRLNHPNSISIFGFGQEDNGDLLWMAMEFVQGRDLGIIIAEDSPLSIQRVVRIMSQTCEALDEAHSANVIHRDLKPANVVVFDHRHTKDFVKVLDFGIAKITDPGEDYQPLTRDGIVCGTPAYMSPEQVQGFELDNRSDLFSLGIILYQMLTNQLPFFAESAVEVATKIVIDEPTPPSEARTDWSYPAELEAVVLKLLSKSKEDRYKNALEVKAALEQCLETLRDRRDGSLDLAPDEIAELMADSDAPVEGAATLQLSTDMIARAMAAEGITPFGKVDPHSETQESKRPAKQARSAPSNPTDVSLRTDKVQMRVPAPASARRLPIGLGVLMLAFAGAAIWWFFLRL